MGKLRSRQQTTSLSKDAVLLVHATSVVWKRSDAQVTSHANIALPMTIVSVKDDILKSAYQA